MIPAPARIRTSGEARHHAGNIDVASLEIETPEQVARVIREAMVHVDAERLLPCTNCGMAPLPRSIAVGKLQALGAGAALMRKELGRRV